MPVWTCEIQAFCNKCLDVDPNKKTDEQIAAEGLDRMEAYMKELGLVMMSLNELGVTENIIEGIAEKTLIMDGGYKVLNKDEIIDILQKSM